MRPLLRCALALGLLLPSTVLLGAPPTAARTLSGELQGAPWRLDVPAAWNGDLVMLAHGYEPVGVPRTTPMAANDSTAPLLAAGYAVAQSAYASQGWAVADAITDMEHLRQHALIELKHVRHTWMLGFSMGVLSPSVPLNASRSTTRAVFRSAAPISVANRSRPNC